MKKWLIAMVLSAAALVVAFNVVNCCDNGYFC